MQRVQGENPYANQASAFNRMDDGIPSRAHPAFEDLAPDKRQPEDANAAHDEIGALYPASWSKTEGADSLLHGTIAWTGGALDQVDDREEQGSAYPDGQPHEQLPRDGYSSKGRRAKSHREGLCRRLR